MRKLWLWVVLTAVAACGGCCRMCCWQRGGSFYNGYCYPAMPAPALQPVPQQTYAQPCSCQ